MKSNQEQRSIVRWKSTDVSEEHVASTSGLKSKLSKDSTRSVPATCYNSSPYIVAYISPQVGRQN
jgi:hypothetical protein